MKRVFFVSGTEKQAICPHPLPGLLSKACVQWHMKSPRDEEYDRLLAFGHKFGWGQVVALPSGFGPRSMAFLATLTYVHFCFRPPAGAIVPTKEAAKQLDAMDPPLNGMYNGKKIYVRGPTQAVLAPAPAPIYTPPAPIYMPPPPVTTYSYAPLPPVVGMDCVC